MSDQEKQAHSMCVTLRIDPATLKAIDKERCDATLSAAMNVRINKSLGILVKNAKDEETDEEESY